MSSTPDQSVWFDSQRRGFFKVWGTLVLGVPLLGVLREVYLTQSAPRSVLGAMLEPVTLQIAGFTLLQAALSLCFSFLVGAPIGLWMGARLRAVPAWVSGILSFPMGVPSLVAISAALFWIGRHGTLTRMGVWPESWLYSAQAVIAVHALWNASWVALRTLQIRVSVPQERIEAARMLGAGKFAELRWVIFPEIRFEWIWVSLQVFQLCAMSFMLVHVLGGGPPVETLETSIYSRLRLSELDFHGAIACVLLQLGVTLVPGVLLLWRTLKLEGERSASLGRVMVSGRGVISSRSGLAVGIPAVFLGLLPGLGLLAPDALRGAIALLSSSATWESIRTSVWISALSTTFSLLQALLLADSALRNSGLRRRAALITALLPSGVSPLALGFGFWLAFKFVFDPFSDNLGWIVVLQSVLAVPFLFRALWPVISRKEDRLLEAARMLGATRLQAFFAVEWPRWRPVLSSSLGTLFMAGVGEVAALSLLSGGDWEGGVPLALQVSRALSQYRFEDAQSWVLILLGVGVAGMVFLKGVAAVLDRGARG